MRLFENVRLSGGDKKVLDAFSEKKSAESKKLSSDGKQLDGMWMGGKKIACWVGGKVDLPDTGSRTGQTVQRALRKYVPKSQLKESKGGSKVFLDESVDKLNTAVLALVECRQLGESCQLHEGVSPEADELILVIENEASLVRQMETIRKNLMRKIASGAYKQVSAEKLFMHLVEAGAKLYTKSYGDKHTPWNKLFSVKIRKEAAKQMTKDFKAEVDSREHDEYIPKSTRKNR